jgi:hypothetical protein
MTINIPDELAEHPDGEEVLQRLVNKLPAYLQLRNAGARLEIMQTEGQNDHVRVYPGTIDHDLIRRHD